MIDSGRLKIIISLIALTLTATLLRFKIALQSDSLFLDALSSDLFSHGGQWADWKLSGAPAFLPDMLLYFIAYPIFPDAFWRIFFVSAVQVFILAASALWLAKEISPQLSKNAVAFIFIMTAFVTLVSAKSNLWLYFYTTNNHFASLIFSILGLGLFFRFFENPSLNTAALLVFIGAIAKSSTAIFFICFTVPAFIVLSGLIIVSSYTEIYRQYRIRLLGMVTILITSHGFSILIEKFLIKNIVIGMRDPISAETAGNSLKIFIRSTLSYFSLDNRLTLAFSIIVVIFFAFLFYGLVRQIKIDEHGVRLFFHGKNTKTGHWKFVGSAAFLFVVLPVNVMGAILSGGFIDLAGYRYIMFPIALGIILFIIFLDRAGRYSATALNRCFFILSMSIFWIGASLIKNPPRPSDEFTRVASCLKDIENGGFVLKAGIADYWNARGVSEHLRKKNPIIATTNDLSPFFWVSTIGPLLRPSKYPEYTYNFAILRNANEIGSFNYTAATIGKILPRPDTTRSCQDGKTQIWLYQGNTLDFAMKSNASAYLFKNKHSNEIVVSGVNLPGIVGKSHGASRIAKSSDDKAGFLSFGPYIDLDEGNYKVLVEYVAKGDPALSIGYVDMGRFNNFDNLVLHKEFIPIASNGVISALLNIPHGGFPQLEIRTWFSGNGELEIRSLTIIKMKNALIKAQW